MCTFSVDQQSINNLDDQQSGRLTDQVCIFDKDSNKHRSQFPVALESLACLTVMEQESKEVCVLGK